MGISSHLNCCKPGPFFGSVSIELKPKKKSENIIQKKIEQNNKEDKNEMENNININTSNEITFKAKSSTYTRGSLLAGEEDNLYNNQAFKPSYNYNNIEEPEDDYSTLYQKLFK